MDLFYKTDKQGKEILCNEDESHQIMMEWEKPYMEKSIEVLNPFGKVLEIGFGMGYSATKICSFENVKEYHVIECMPIVWEKFEKFKTEQQHMRPDLKMNLIKGRWEDVLQTTEAFNCIYFDDYILNAEMQVNVNDVNRILRFLCKVLLKHSMIGTRISFYSTINCKEMYKNVNCINVECIEYKIDIPENCKYAKGDTMYIPILTKISTAESNLHDKLMNIKPTNQEDIKKEMEKQMERQMKYKQFFDDMQNRGPSCGLIVIDNFCKNPYEIRKHILTLDFSIRGNYPGQRTISYATQHLKDIIQDYVMPFGGKITDFQIPNGDNGDGLNLDICNGSFYYTNSRNRPWIQYDRDNNWGGVLCMTPNAPLSSGIAFYKFKDGTECQRDQNILENVAETETYRQDITKWQLVDKVGNVFNRLILFNSKRFHMSLDCFGDSKENGRIFQGFFFSTEK